MPPPTATIASRPHRTARPLQPRLLSLLAWLDLCLERARERRLLAGLSERKLKDIGLTRADVARETGRWPWDGADRHR